MSAIVKEADDLTYGGKLNSDTGLKPGDLLIDSINLKNKEEQIGSYFMPGHWPGLKEGSTIWIDGDKIPPWKDILFRNGPKDDTGWNEVKNITIRAIPGTQIKANSFNCTGLLNLKMPLESKDFNGLQALQNKKFLSGNFGLHVKCNNPGGHGIKITNLDGGVTEMDCFESSGGFSNLRFAEGNRMLKNTLKIKNFYCHDTIRGEGLYLGQAVGIPVAKIILDISDGFIVRSACEGLQMQHLIGADVRNLTIYCTAFAWLNAFQDWNDSGIQYNVDSGINILHDIILDGFASNGINPFSSHEGKDDPIKTAIVKNILLNEGRATGSYLHSSNSFGVDWTFEDIFYRAFNNTYTRTGKPNLPYIISKLYGEDEFLFINPTYDHSKERFLENGERITLTNPQLATLPPINYVNSGFSETTGNIMQWHQHWGAYHPISKTAGKEVPIPYFKGQVVRDENLFYKVLADHVSENIRPKDSGKFLPLKWDENAVRNDAPGYNAQAVQRYDSPDDLRLKATDFWAKRGMGYTDQELIIDEYFQNDKRFTKTSKGKVYRQDMVSFKG